MSEFIHLTKAEYVALTTPQRKYYDTIVMQHLVNTGGWEDWLQACAGHFCTSPFGDHHRKFWDWVYTIEVGETPTPAALIAIFARGGAKSTTSELAVANLGCRGERKYFLYVCQTQSQADDHVGNIATILESEGVTACYPNMSEKLLNKHGDSKGWRRNRIRTADGFTVDALGLDTAARGLNLEGQRPDGMVFDDIDSESDTEKTIQKNLDFITRKLLPAGSKDLCAIFIQNLVHETSIFARLAGLAFEPDGTPIEVDMLTSRKVIGPVPAILDLEYEQRTIPLVDKHGKPVVDEVSGEQGEEKKWFITGGTPTWEGQDIEACEGFMNKFGPTAFIAECQHEPEARSGGMFDELPFHQILVKPEDVPDLGRKIVAVDPAVTNTDASDAHGISVSGLGVDGKAYVLHSWERRDSPLDSIKRAIKLFCQYECTEIIIEGDQGGDTWRDTYQLALNEMETESPELFEPGEHGRRLPTKQKIRIEKAGSIGPKIMRGQDLLAAFEADRVRIVLGTHQILQSALVRFPLFKPFDLVDATYWSLWDLLGLSSKKSKGRVRKPKRTTVNFQRTTRR